MSLPKSLELALRRLNAALDQLDAAAERRAQVDARRANLEEELAVMQDDRSRLAVELDGALAHAHALEHANTEAVRRVERASASIRGILADGGADEPRP